MKYTLTELNSRVSPEARARYLWNARLSRLWKSYLRLASGLAGLIGAAHTTIFRPAPAVRAARETRRTSGNARLGADRPDAPERSA